MLLFNKCVASYSNFIKKFEKFFMFKKAFWVPYEDSGSYPTLTKAIEAIEADFIRLRAYEPLVSFQTGKYVVTYVVYSNEIQKTKVVL